MAFTRVSRQLRISRDTARLLSQATYHQLVLAIRELVANAHDGNAAHIRVSVGIEKEIGGDLKVVDDGDGMSRDDFDNEFLNLGKTWKTPPASGGVRKNRFGRPLLGRFGIGFISAIPFANEVLAETKRREDGTVSGVRIDCAAILSGSAKGDDSSFIFPGWNRSPTPEDPDKFTRIEMIGLNRRAYDSIDASIRSGWYEIREQRAVPIDTKRRQDYLRTWLSRVVPLGYDRVVASPDLTDALHGLMPPDYIPPTVSVNGQRLQRLAPEARALQSFRIEGERGDWRGSGVLWSPHEAIDPVYARGIAVRVGDMSVGEPGYFGLNSMGRVYGKLQHITGEIQVSGLDSDLQLDRQWFYPTPSTYEFQEAVREQIIRFEGRLQKKAVVMQKFRLLKKSVDSTNTDPLSATMVAPILNVPARVQALIEKAKEAGIQVREVEGDTLRVPKGEGRLTVGKEFGQQLLKVRLGKRIISFEVAEGGPAMTTTQLVDCVLDSAQNLVRIVGPHVLISANDVAIANLRLLAALKEAVATKLLTRDQVESLLEELSKAYR